VFKHKKTETSLGLLTAKERDREARRLIAIARSPYSTMAEQGDALTRLEKIFGKPTGD
jgi:hypothetical protein